MKDFDNFLTSEEFEKFAHATTKVDMPHIIDFTPDVPSLMKAIEELNKATSDKSSLMFMELLRAYHEWLHQE